MPGKEVDMKKRTMEEVRENINKTLYPGGQNKAERGYISLSQGLQALSSVHRRNDKGGQA